MGLDVHKDGGDIATADAGPDGVDELAASARGLVGPDKAMRRWSLKSGPIAGPAVSWEKVDQCEQSLRTAVMPTGLLAEYSPIGCPLWPAEYNVSQLCPGC